MCSHTKYRGNNRMSISLQVSWTTLKSTIPASISKHFLFCSFKREMFSFTIFVLALRINLYISSIHDKVSALFFLLFPRLLFWQNALEWFCTNHDGIFFHTVLYTLLFRNLMNEMKQCHWFHCFAHRFHMLIEQVSPI
mgnify:CR=1 FL=1